MEGKKKGKVKSEGKETLPLNPRRSDSTRSPVRHSSRHAGENRMVSDANAERAAGREEKMAKKQLQARPSTNIPTAAWEAEVAGVRQRLHVASAKLRSSSSFSSAAAADSSGGESAGGCDADSADPGTGFGGGNARVRPRRSTEQPSESSRVA
jgi:hypothetical protein